MVGRMVFEPGERVPPRRAQASLVAEWDFQEIDYRGQRAPRRSRR
jgi:hypothetical protein